MDDQRASILSSSIPLKKNRAQFSSSSTFASSFIMHQFGDPSHLDPISLSSLSNLLNDSSSFLGSRLFHHLFEKSVRHLLAYVCHSTHIRNPILEMFCLREMFLQWSSSFASSTLSRDTRFRVIHSVFSSIFLSNNKNNSGSGSSASKDDEDEAINIPNASVPSTSTNANASMSNSAITTSSTASTAVSISSKL
jgi:hypothetical protein